MNAKASMCKVGSFKDKEFSTITITDPQQIRRQEIDAKFRYPNDPTIKPASESPTITWTDPNFINRMYHKQNHLNGWDEFAGKKAKDDRVQLIPSQQKRDLKITLSSGTLDTFEIGNANQPDFGVIFIHGGGGDKTLGANEWSFGGNFNRLQNLVVRNNGVYYSPTVTHDKTGVTIIGNLIDFIHSKNPKAQVIVACGSAGGAICTGLEESEKYAPRLGGIIHVGSANAPNDIIKTPAFKYNVPTLFSHGSYDPVMSWEAMKTRYDALKKAKPKYPTQFFLYHGGIHGTPIRMIDWRENLNFILQYQCQNQKNADPLHETSPKSGAK